MPTIGPLPIAASLCWAETTGAAAKATAPARATQAVARRLNWP
jgi:hypothetical protein